MKIINLSKKFHVLILMMTGLFLLSSTPAHSDELVLTNGNKIEGDVTKKGDEYVVETPVSELRISADLVEKMVEKKTRWEKYKEKANQLENMEKPTADDHYEIYEWASKQNLEVQAQKHLEKALNLDPAHEETRMALGYVKYNEKWMDRPTMMRKRGFKRYNGNWLPAETVNQLREEMAVKTRKKRVLSQIRSYLREMASTPVKQKRQEIYEELISYGQENGAEDIRKLANKAKNYYDRSWKMVLMKKTHNITSTIRLTKAELSQPIEDSRINTTIGQSFAFGQVTGVIELPQQEVHQYKGTVVIPSN